MADINLTRGAQLAAQIIAEGGDWRDIKSLMDGGSGLADAVLAAEGQGDLGLDKFYKGDFEYGEDQADLQTREAGRTDEDGSSRLRRRTQQAIADEVYEREAKTRGESSEAKYLRGQNEQMARRTRERKIIGGAPPKYNTTSALDQLGAVIKSGTLSPVEQEKAERAYSRLRASTDPAYQRALDVDQGRKAVTESAKNFNQDIRNVNDIRAGAMETLPDLNLERIGEVISAEVPGGYKDYIREVPMFAPEEDPRNFGYADLEISPKRGTLYTDASGQPLGIQGPQMPASNANANGTSQALNAPQGGTRLIDVMERNQFSARESGTYPQVDISGEFKELESRLAAQGIAVPGGIRTMEQAEAALNQVLASGGKFNAPGSRQIVDNPGAAEALERMRYTQPEVARLSNALIQTELASRQNVNLDRKAAHAVGLASHPYELAKPIVDPSKPLLIGPQELTIAERNARMVQNGAMSFGAKEAMGDFNASVDLQAPNARVKPRFAGLTGENIEGTPQERKEALADAQRPYTGLVAGEEPVGIEGKRDNPNLRYNRAGTTVNPAPAKGPDGKKYQGRMKRVGKAETTPEGIRSAITGEAMKRSQKTGKKVDLHRNEQNIINALAVQQRHDNSIDRGAFRAELQRNEAQDAPRLIDDNIRNTLAELNSAGKPEQGPYRPLTADLKAELNALDGGRGGGPKNPGGGYMVAPDGPSNNRGYMSAPEGPGIGRRARNARRGAGYAAASIAGLAGINAMVSGEKEKRQQEAMYR